jgi:hypothetical protein
LISVLFSVFVERDSSFIRFLKNQLLCSYHRSASGPPLQHHVAAVAVRERIGYLGLIFYMFLDKKQVPICRWLFGVRLNAGLAISSMDTWGAEHHATLQQSKHRAGYPDFFFLPKICLT